jgi:hypothetical protein
MGRVAFRGATNNTTSHELELKGMVNMLPEIIVGAIVGVIASYATSFFNYQHLVKQAWLDRKWFDYKEILAALSDAMMYSETMRDLISSQGEHAPDYGVTKTRYEDSLRQLRRYAAAGSVVLSNEAVEVVKTAIESVSNDPGDVPEEVVFDAEITALKSALGQIRAIAQQELGKSLADAL